MRPFSTSGFFAADQLYSILQILLSSSTDDARARAGAVFSGMLVRLSMPRIAHASFELANAGIDKALAFLGRICTQRFGKVAVRAATAISLGEFDVELVLQAMISSWSFCFNCLSGFGHGSSIVVAG